MNKVLNFNGWCKLNEQASLSDIGAPEKMISYITGNHELKSNKPEPRPGDSPIQFHTRREPSASRGGHWPSDGQGGIVGADAAVTDTITGAEAIVNYMTQGADFTKDTDIKYLVHNPKTENYIYLTRRTGKMSPSQLRDANLSREESREHGTSNKRGIFYRAMIMDEDSEELIAAWEGTLGQIAQEWDSSTVLYVIG
jgi:hypothetical protein